MSFDNIGSQFEYVRYGADWDQLVKNVDLFKKLQQQGHWGGIHAVYNIYNCTRLVEFKQWAHERGLTVVWQNLSTPHSLDPSKHSTKLKQLALAEIERLFEQKLVSDAEQQFFNRVKQNLTRDNGDATQEFQTHIAKIEQHYHTDKLGQFRTLWPELAFLLDI